MTITKLGDHSWLIVTAENSTGVRVLFEPSAVESVTLTDALEQEVCEAYAEYLRDTEDRTPHAYVIQEKEILKYLRGKQPFPA